MGEQWRNGALKFGVMQCQQIKHHPQYDLLSKILVVSLDNGITQSHMLWLSGSNKNSMMFLCLLNTD
jgi:hypothetical protein